MLGLGGAVVGLLAGFGAGARRWTSCSRRSAPTCPTAARSSSCARSGSRCSPGTAVTVVGGPVAGAARGARDADRGDARGRRARASAAQPRRRRRIVARSRDRALVLVRLVLLAVQRRRDRDDRDPRRDHPRASASRRRARGSRRRRHRMIVALAHAARPPVRAARDHRPARARQHDPPPRPHRGDRRGADDRPRARQPDLDPRRRARRPRSTTRSTPPSPAT